MSSVVRVWSVVGLLVALSLVSSASAQDNDQLRAAGKLFEKQEYVAAQEALLEIDRTGLSKSDQTRLDELLGLVATAVEARQKSAHDLIDADSAYRQGQWDVADHLYQMVEDNEYAVIADRKRAAGQRLRIIEKKRLAEAAEPSGTVEGTVVTQPVRLASQETQVAEEPAVSSETGPRRLTPTDELRLKDELLWQRAVAKAQQASTKAREAIAAHEYSEARKWVDTALQTIEAAARYAEPVSKYAAAKQTVIQLKQDLEDSAAAYDQARAKSQQDEIVEQIAKRRRLLDQQRIEKVEQLFNSSEQLRNERRFAEAAEVLREILRLDPSSARARYELQWAEDFESFDRQVQWQHDVYSQQRKALIDAEEAMIPWTSEVMYPQNWLELTAARSQAGISAGDDLDDIELNRTLDSPLAGEPQFDETAFERVVAYLREMTGINITVDWTDLEDNGIERDSPITFQASGLSARVVLAEVLSQVGGDVQLAYAVGDGLLRVATKEKLDRDKNVLIYDIRDLLFTVPQAEIPQMDVSQGMGESGQGSSGGDMFQGNRGQNQQQNMGQGQAAGLTQQIIDIIRQTVEPDSWRETGGGDASIRDLNGQLIVYNTSGAQTQVKDLLSQLRETRALQISVETRFLDVTSNFLEEFGVDLDFVFNSGSAGYDTIGLSDPGTGSSILVPRQFSRIGAFATPPAFGQALTPPGTAGNPVQPYGQAAFVPPRGGIGPHVQHMTPITMQQSSRTLAIPRGTGVPGTFAGAVVDPALSIAGSFLDNIQVDFLIRATQANARSSIVQAPRIVLFNAGSASIQIGRSRQYVASLEPRLAEGAVGFTPQTQVAQSGVTMWVRGSIAADRRYVTLTLILSERGEPDIQQVEVQRASGNSPGSFISLVEQSFQTLQTTVSVPDGGTVLLGGMKQVGETEVEAGVPILSKIPILKRAFTNQSTVKDTRTMLVLVKAKIIIQKEAEEEAFPTFTSTGY